eukprot:gene17366-biopygen2125
MTAATRWIWMSSTQPETQPNSRAVEVDVEIPVGVCVIDPTLQSLFQQFVTVDTKLPLPSLPLAAKRCRLAAWRHGGKAWRHGGKAGGINASGGKAWRHGGMAAKPEPWRQSRQCQQSCSPQPIISVSVQFVQLLQAIQFGSVQSVSFSFAEIPEPPWRHGGKAGGKACGKALAAKRWRQSKAGWRQSVAAWRQSVAEWRHSSMAAKRGGMAAKRGGTAAWRH